MSRYSITTRNVTVYTVDGDDYATLEEAQEAQYLLKAEGALQDLTNLIEEAGRRPSKRKKNTLERISGLTNEKIQTLGSPSEGELIHDRCETIAKNLLGVLQPELRAILDII